MLHQGTAEFPRFAITVKREQNLPAFETRQSSSWEVGTARAQRKKKIMKTRTLGPMKTKQLGNSDLFITPVGFGAWAIGGSGWEYA